MVDKHFLSFFHLLSSLLLNMLSVLVVHVHMYFLLRTVFILYCVIHYCHYCFYGPLKRSWRKGDAGSWLHYWTVSYVVFSRLNAGPRLNASLEKTLGQNCFFFSISVGGV